MGISHQKFIDFAEVLGMTQMAGGGRGCHLVCVIMTYAYENRYVAHPLSCTNKNEI